MLEMAIAVTPRALSIERELTLAKVALLYADHAVVYSPGAAILNDLASIDKLEDVEILLALLPAMAQTKPELLQHQASLEQLLSMLGGSRRERRKMPRRRRQELLNGLRGVRDHVMNNMLRPIGWDELQAAVASGFVSIHQFRLGYETEDTVQEFADLLEATFSEGRAYPLLDRDSASLVQSAVAGGLFEVSDSSSARGRQAQLASYLFERLPTFESASVAELIDIRHSLENPLRRFRGSMVEFADSIKNESWSSEFANDAEQMLIAKVEPAVADIEDALASNRILEEVGTRVLTRSIMGGSLAWAVLGAGGIDPRLPMTAAGAGIVIEALKNWRDRRREIESNRLYYYYKAGERISGRSN